MTWAQVFVVIGSIGVPLIVAVIALIRDYRQSSKKFKQITGETSSYHGIGLPDIEKSISGVKGRFDIDLTSIRGADDVSLSSLKGKSKGVNLWTIDQNVDALLEIEKEKNRKVSATAIAGVDSEKHITELKALIKTIDNLTTENVRLKIRLNQEQEKVKQLEKLNPPPPNHNLRL
jgi:hypothetical protein